MRVPARAEGVGKTTTIRSIMGLTPPQAGRIVWQGADITGWPSYRVARAGLGFVPEDRRPPPRAARALTADGQRPRARRRSGAPVRRVRTHSFRSFAPSFS